jgi:hypothetical protein
LELLQGEATSTPTASNNNNNTSGTGGNSALHFRISAIQILGILVSNGLPLYDRDQDSVEVPSEMKFLEMFLSNLSHSLKDVYASTAEVCGLALLQQHSDDALSGHDSVTPTPSASISTQTQQQHASLLEQLLRDKVHFAIPASTPTEN